MRLHRGKVHPHPENVENVPFHYHIREMTRDFDKIRKDNPVLYSEIHSDHVKFIARYETDPELYDKQTIFVKGDLLSAIFGLSDEISELNKSYVMEIEAIENQHDRAIERYDRKEAMKLEVMGRIVDGATAGGKRGGVGLATYAYSKELGLSDMMSLGNATVATIGTHVILWRYEMKVGCDTLDKTAAAKDKAGQRRLKQIKELNRRYGDDAEKRITRAEKKLMKAYEDRFGVYWGEIASSEDFRMDELYKEVIRGDVEPDAIAEVHQRIMNHRQKPIVTRTLEESR